MTRPAAPGAPFARSRRLVSVAALAAACATAMTPGRAETATPFGELSLHGFGTLALTRSNSDQAEFVRDLSQPRGASRNWTPRVDSRFGLQASLRASESSEFVVQAVSRYNWEGKASPEINWAFVKFDATPNATLRAGRLGTEFYMLADSRHVGYSYLTIRPPADYYGTLPFNFVDGVDAAATLPLAGGLLRGKVFAGSDAESLPIVGEQWRLHGSAMAGGFIDYQKGAWQWRIGAAGIRFERDFDLLKPLIGALNAAALATGIAQAATAAERIAVADKLSRMYSAGVVYDEGPLQLQLMLSNTRHDSDTYEKTRAGYLIGAYRIGEFRPFAGLSWTHGKANEVASGLPPVAPFSAIDAALAEYMRKGHTEHRTLSLGTRWDFRRGMALKAQFDRIDGEPSSIFLVQQNTPEYRGRISLFSLALDFVF